MPQSLVARSAAPLALVAGALVVITRGVIMVTTPRDMDSLKVYVLTATHAINGVASMRGAHRLGLPLRGRHPRACLRRARGVVAAFRQRTRYSRHTRRDRHRLGACRNARLRSAPWPHCPAV